MSLKATSNHRELYTEKIHQNPQNIYIYVYVHASLDSLLQKIKFKRNLWNLFKVVSKNILFGNSTSHKSTSLYFFWGISCVTAENAGAGHSLTVTSLCFLGASSGLHQVVASGRRLAFRPMGRFQAQHWVNLHLKASRRSLMSYLMWGINMYPTWRSPQKMSEFSGKKPETPRFTEQKLEDWSEMVRRRPCFFHTRLISGQFQGKPFLLQPSYFDWKGAPNDNFIVMDTFLVFFLGLFSKFGAHILPRAIEMAGHTLEYPFESNIKIRISIRYHFHKIFCIPKN